VLAVIGMLHDKDIAGTLANLAGSRRWYCAPLEGPRGATAEQLMEHLRKGTVYSSVAQAWHARWRTLNQKIPCWCVVHSTRWHMSWKR
jgi:dihydrofolate synthase/folylpolyglutamate synthase